MIIYSVSIQINKEVEEEWLAYMTNEHIDDVMKTGYFEKVDFRKIVFPADEKQGHYSIEYYCATMQALEDYQKYEAPRLQAEHTEKFAGQFSGSRKYMEEIK